VDDINQRKNGAPSTDDNGDKPTTPLPFTDYGDRDFREFEGDQQPIPQRPHLFNTPHRHFQQQQQNNNTPFMAAGDEEEVIVVGEVKSKSAEVDEWIENFFQLLENITAAAPAIDFLKEKQKIEIQILKERLKKEKVSI
jgi:hypothetical protein